MDWIPNMPHFWSKLSMTPQGSIHTFVSERGTVESYQREEPLSRIREREEPLR